MKVEQVMTREVRFCSPDATLEEAARLLWEHDVGVVPIVRDEHVVGLLSDRDVCMAAYTQGRPLREIRAATVMSKDVFGCTLDCSLEDVLQELSERQVRRLPVLGPAGQLLGLISLNDVAREAAVGHGRISPRQVVDTLRAIGAPRGDKAFVAQPEPLPQLVGAAG